jgi:pimeloyl-ACP methyl ester carboxylesterase
VLLNTTHTNPLKTMVLSGLFQALRWPVLEPLLRLQILLWPLAWASAWQSYLSGSAHIATRLSFGRDATRSQLEHVTLLMTRNPQQTIARGDLAMFRWDATNALRQMKVPVLVIAGSIDIITKPDASRTIAAAIHDARLRIVDDANHMGFLERSAIYNQAIAAFADDLKSREHTPRREVLRQPLTAGEERRM